MDHAVRLVSKYSRTGDRLADTSAPSDVFDREFGAQMTAWELQCIRRFREHLSGRRYVYRGFVHHTRVSTQVLLSPSPWILDGVIALLPEGVGPPPEAEMVEVVGRRVAVPGVTRKDMVAAVMVEDIRVLGDRPLAGVRAPLGMPEISEMLFEHVGMPENSKQVFTRLFISSPPYLDSIGGLATGIQALAARRNVKRLLTFIRRVLPHAITRGVSEYRRVRGVQVRTPRLWRMRVGNVGRKEIRRLCVERKDPLGYREVSVSTMADGNTAPMLDVPIAVSYDDFWVEHPDPRLLQLPVVKAAITFHMMTPRVAARSIEAATKHIIARLEHLRDVFGLPDTALSRGHVLDADLLGRPMSTVRLARSAARGLWRDRVTAKDLKHEWDRVLEPALREFIEVGELQMTTEEIVRAGDTVERHDTCVWRALQRLDTGQRGSTGPTVEEIAREAGVHVSTAERALERMKRDSMVYEPRPGHYRMV